MVKYGYYNSKNKDRTYDAEDMGILFSGLVKDGVFQSKGDALKCTTGVNANFVTVGTGLAWFDGTWTVNTTSLQLTLSAPDPNLDRYDSVMVIIDKQNRTNKIEIVKGTPSSNPAYPTSGKHTSGSAQFSRYPLCHILRKHGVTSINQADIKHMIGTSDCPYVTGILDTIEADTLFAQWQSEFDIWFHDLNVTLDGDVAANLASDIIDINNRTRQLAFRGLNLGSSITAEQNKTIASGEFKDLFIGDYWTYKGIKWRIADFDYWYGTGTNQHHIVIVPDTIVGTPSAFVDDARYSVDTEPRHSKSYMYAMADINNSYILSAENVTSRKLGWCNTWERADKNTNGIVRNYHTANVQVAIMSARSVYGTDLAFNCWTYGDPGQLSLFRTHPEFIKSADNKMYWLWDYARIQNNTYAEAWAVGPDGYPILIEASGLKGGSIYTRPIYAYGGKA